ncbi:MAG: hypothetical protein CL916_13790 [Deltaproteobacteria bacterium]|nr:hypothetical protein [Deltaproteobacteria bacterium]
MILVIIFFSICFATPQTSSFRKGKKVRVFMTYGDAIEGWVSQYSSTCIVISNRSGLRALDLRTVESVELDSLRIPKKELLLLLRQEKEERIPPKRSSIIILGSLNAGLPFGLIQQKRESIGLGVLDAAFLGGGIYTFVQQRSASIPIFIGLIGLRSWSINEVLSRSRTKVIPESIDACIK